MPRNRRQVRLLIIACLIVLLVLGAGVVWFYCGYLTLRVATGIMADAGQKFVAAFMRTLADEHPRVRLKIVQIAEPDARLRALAAGAVGSRRRSQRPAHRCPGADSRHPTP